MANGNFFQKVRIAKPEKNWFDLSHDVKTTLDFGALVPVLCAPAYPGDRWKVSIEHLVRFAPMLAPVFNKFDVRFDSFFYPTRLVWKKSEDFYRGGKDGVTDVPVPMIKITDIVQANQRYFKYSSSEGGIGSSGLHFNINSLADYLNLPTFDVMIDRILKADSSITDTDTLLPALIGQITAAGDEDISIIPFLMYNGIYREYYRDQFLQPEVDELTEAGISQLGSGAVMSRYIDADDIITALASNPADGSSYQQGLRASILSALVDLRLVNYPKDYFTSALPSPQLGPSVSLPIGDLAVVNRVNGSNTNQSATSLGAATTDGLVGHVGFIGAAATGAGKARLYADASSNDTTIPDLRRANKLQEFLEKSVLGGNRFIEWILAHFGVQSSDARLDRPEYLGRVKNPVMISEVTSTADTEQAFNNSNRALGSMAGHGVSANGGFLFDKFVEEPGYFFVMMSIVPKQAYFQGYPKHFTLKDRFDTLIPEFAEIGMQPILKKEITPYFTGSEDIFGYTERMAEFKFMNNEIHGDFRDTLAYWHDARVFAEGSNDPADPSISPVLNQNFIKVSPINGDLNRIFAYEGSDYRHLYALLHLNMNVERCLPEYPDYRL